MRKISAIVAIAGTRRPCFIPATDQTAALDNLSAAASQAREIIKSSCPASVQLTTHRSSGRRQRLDATIKAIQIVLSPLEKFYETLSDKQGEAVQRGEWFA
jgi:LTXXQ motif family protein